MDFIFVIRLLSPHVDVPPLCIILRYLQLGLPVATRSMCRPHIFLLRTRRKRKTVHIVLWILINEQSSWTTTLLLFKNKTCYTPNIRLDEKVWNKNRKSIYESIKQAVKNAIPEVQEAFSASINKKKDRRESRYFVTRQITGNCLNNVKLVRSKSSLPRADARKKFNEQQQHGFQVYHIDEFRTSRCCPTCLDSHLQTFKQLPNSLPYRRQETSYVTCHGLLL